MKNLKYILFCLLFLGIYSCSENDYVLDNNDGAEKPTEAISFRPNLGTLARMATDVNFKSTFEKNDAIGIFVVQNGQQLKASGNYEDNRKLTYNEGSWILDGEDIFYPTNGSSLHIYAYYPYVNGVDPTNFNFEVNANQSLVANCNASDLVLAKVENATVPTIDLLFSHTLSLVQVEVVKGKNMPAFSSALTVTLNHCLTTALAGFASQTANAVNGTARDVSMLRFDPTSNTYNFRALVPSQLIAQGVQLFSFVQNTSGSEIDYSYKAETAVELTAGKVTKWKITLNAAELPAHSYSVGDVYPFTGTPMGIVFEVSNGGENGKIVSLQEKQDRWGDFTLDESATGVVGIRDVDNGKTATQNLIKLHKSWGNFNSDYALFYWLYTTMNAENELGEWYMPAKNELKSLYASISGMKYADIEHTWTDSNTMPNFDSAGCQTARIAFNGKITVAGGTALNLYGQYWTSTEISPDKVWSIHFETAKIQDDKIKYDTAPRIRPIMQF